MAEKGAQLSHPRAGHAGHPHFDRTPRASLVRAAAGRLRRALGADAAKGLLQPRLVPVLPVLARRGLGVHVPHAHHRALVRGGETAGVPPAGAVAETHPSDRGGPVARGIHARDQWIAERKTSRDGKRLVRVLLANDRGLIQERVPRNLYSIRDNSCSFDPHDGSLRSNYHLHQEVFVQGRQVGVPRTSTGDRRRCDDPRRIARVSVVETSHQDGVQRFGHHDRLLVARPGLLRALANGPGGAWNDGTPRVQGSGVRQFLL